MLLLLPGVSSRPVDTGLVLLFFQTQRAYCCPCYLNYGCPGRYFTWDSGSYGFLCEWKDRCTKGWLLQVTPMAFPVAALLYTLKLSHVLAILYQLSAFFWSVPLRKMKARAPCLVSKSLPFQKQDIFHAICHQPERHEAVGQCAWWLCATHKISKTYCNTALIVLPLSTLSRRNIALRQHWMLNKGDICFRTSEFPQGGTYQSSGNYHPSFISSMSNISPSWYLGHCPLLSSWLPLE